jgi:hypothetical protein
MRVRPLAILALVGSPGCVQSPTVPKVGTQEVTLQIRTSATALAAGETDTITVTVTNQTAEELRIIFETTCQVRVYVRTQSARIVVPPNGVHDCVRVASQMVIPGEGSVDRQVLWKGTEAFEPPGSPTRLPAGEYFVTAELVVGSFRATAGGVKVTLLP